MLHIMLDAENHRLRVHYKCEMRLFQFYKVAQVHYLGEMDIFSMSMLNVSSCLWQCKNYKKNQVCFSRVMITNVLPPFFGSQCMCVINFQSIAALDSVEHQVSFAVINLVFVKFRIHQLIVPHIDIVTTCLSCCHIFPAEFYLLQVLCSCASACLPSIYCLWPCFGILL